MNKILNPPEKCQCFDCTKDDPLPSILLQRLCVADPVERSHLTRHLYYAKPFHKSPSSSTKHWKSVTHRDYVIRPDMWSTHFPERFPNEHFTDYVCRKWCKEEHNQPLPPGGYSVPIMPDYFEVDRRTTYNRLRPCETVYCQDFHWKDDHRPQGPFPSWCLKGEPPEFADCDRN